MDVICLPRLELRRVVVRTYSSVGLVVKVSACRAADLGSIPRHPRGAPHPPLPPLLPKSSHTFDLEIWFSSYRAR